MVLALEHSLKMRNRDFKPRKSRLFTGLDFMVMEVAQWCRLGVQLKLGKRVKWAEREMIKIWSCSSPGLIPKTTRCAPFGWIDGRL